jgi:hypothetical protein
LSVTVKSTTVTLALSSGLKAGLGSRVVAYRRNESAQSILRFVLLIDDYDDAVFVCYWGGRWVFYCLLLLSFWEVRAGGFSYFS